MDRLQNRKQKIKCNTCQTGRRVFLKSFWRGPAEVVLRSNHVRAHQTISKGLPPPACAPMSKSACALLKVQGGFQRIKIKAFNLPLLVTSVALRVRLQLQGFSSFRESYHHSRINRLLVIQYCETPSSF